MQKILISVLNDTIIFSYKEQSNTPAKPLYYTNVINGSELAFSKKYIEENQKLMALFIQEICQEKNLYRATIETNELALFLCDLFKKNPYITAICIRENNPLAFSLYEKLADNKYINYIEAHTIQQFMIELLDKRGIRSESRTEVFYPSHFMQSNNLTSFSKIFYKMNIRVEQILSEEDKDDLAAFCNINKYLKTVHIDIFNKNDLEDIIIILSENRMKNIQILIYENIRDYKTIEYLKRLNKNNKSKNIKINLVYSKEYLKNNLFTQIILNTLKICGLMTIMLVISVISYVGVSNFISLQQVTQIQEDIKNTISEKENNNTEEKKLVPSNTGKAIKNNYIVSLLSTNEDVVGWLKVNETNIDYPVVQGKDNDYYLKNNWYKESDKNGWIFMDYRNSNYNLDANTIFFGHNTYYSGVMFGSLANAYKKSWYSKPENQIISFDTIYESNKYQIFSIYKVPKTNDYLKTYFENEQEFSDFINLIKDRSVNDFKVDVKYGDKIITLSTCSNDNDRLVVHAKLIN